MKIFIFLSLVFFANILYANHAVIFMYHHFGKDIYPSTNIRLTQFQAHLDYLETNNYNVWPLSKVIYSIKYKMYIPEKTVALTVDDAYISTYTHAYPMLKKKNFPFTVFVNTNPIGKNAINYMTWEQMREMQDNGAEFSNHSSTHDYLIPKNNETQKQWKNRIRNEIQTAQKTLQKELGRDTNTNPKIISYPFGEFTKKSAAFIASLGYIGVTQTSGVVNHNSDLKKIPRYAMSEAFANLEDFKLKLNTRALQVASVEPWGTKVHFNPPKLKLRLQSSVKLLQCYTSDGKSIKVKKVSQKKYEIQASSPLKGVRDRYTCTAKDENNTWLWYSHLWILNK